MPTRLQFARPMRRCRAGLHTNEARRHFLEERQDVATLQLTAEDHLAIGVNAVHLKTRLGDVETDCLNCLHVWLLSIVGALTAPTFMALACRGRSRPHHQQQRRREEGDDPTAEAGPTVQALIKGTFGTDPRMPSPFGRAGGEARRFAFGRAAGNFSGLGVTGPSRNWKPSLSRPCSSLSTITRTCPPAFKWPNSTSSASGFLMCS